MDHEENCFLEDILSPEELEAHYAELEALKAREPHPMDCSRELNQAVEESTTAIKH